MKPTISDYVRQYDRDHFICSLFVSKSLRTSYLTLYALNIEVNNIVYNFREAITALVRLRWWREKINSIYHNKIVNDNQIISELKSIIHFSSIPESLFNDYFDGYEQMICHTSYKSSFELEKIAAETTVNLIKILFAISVKNYCNDELAYHCGVSWHLINNLRNIKKIPIKNLSKETIVSIFERAKYHISQVEKFIKTVPKRIISIVLQVKLAKLYLKRIFNKNFDITNKEIFYISPTMQIKMLFYYLIL